MDSRARNNTGTLHAPRSPSHSDCLGDQTLSTAGGEVRSETVQKMYSCRFQTVAGQKCDHPPFTFRAFSRRFYPMRLSISTFTRRRRNNISLTLGILQGVAHPLFKNSETLMLPIWTRPTGGDYGAYIIKQQQGSQQTKP